MFSPKEVAERYVDIGINKARLKISKMFVLGILAGMFIACGAVASNTASSVITNASAAKIIAGAVFPVGLLMVLVAGSELFTGNCLMIIPVLEKKIKIRQMLKNWITVYIGNFVGAVIVALIAYYSGQLDLFGGALAVTTIKTAAAKCSLSFGKAVLLGIMCNFLVCIAVWNSFAADDVAGKAVGLFLPIFAFVISGFEHSIANMYYIPAGLLAASNSVYYAAASETVTNISNLSIENFFLHNLIPVTIGNIIGGMILVGCSYWFVYLKKDKRMKGKGGKTKKK